MIAIVMNYFDDKEVKTEPLTLEQRGTMYHNVPFPKLMRKDRRASSTALSMSAPVMTGGSAMAAQMNYAKLRKPPNPFTLHLALTTPRHPACIPVQAEGWRGVASAKARRGRGVIQPCCARHPRARAHPFILRHVGSTCTSDTKFRPLDHFTPKCLGRDHTPP